MIHPPGSAEQVAAFQRSDQVATFQNAKISGMVFNPVTNSYVTQAEADAYMAIQRVHDANMEKQAEENCDSGGQAQPEPFTRNLEKDLKEAIALTFCLRRLVANLHPDVRKIINLGELLNEHK